jgi:hypothetical protein
MATKADKTTEVDERKKIGIEDLNPREKPFLSPRELAELGWFGGERAVYSGIQCGDIGHFGSPADCGSRPCGLSAPRSSRRRTPLPRPEPPSSRTSRGPGRDHLPRAD